MKNTLVAALGMLFCLLSCKKDEIKENNNPASAEANQATWISIKETGSQGQTHQSLINIDEVNDSILNSSMVFVFIKDESNVPQLLPAKIGTSEWYYQVEKGKIIINRISANDTDTKNENEFQYKILSPDTIKNLEKKGFSKTALLNMNFSQLNSAIH